MNKTWYEEKTKDCESAKAEIEKILKEDLKLSDIDLKKVMRKLDSQYGDPMQELDFRYIDYCSEDNFEEDYDAYKNIVKISNLDKLFTKYSEKNYLNRYLDSIPVEFDGDILITDPCYVIREKHHGTIPITNNDWSACNYGYNMEKLGINHFMTKNTLYGDWSCTTFDSDTKEPIGSFCADTGLVSVMLLDEVLKYNPGYDCNKETEYVATIIRDFKGTVQFVVKHIDGYYEDTTDYHQKGDYWEEYYLEVIGHGINKVSGKPINFVGKQTGF